MSMVLHMMRFPVVAKKRETSCRRKARKKSFYYDGRFTLASSSERVKTSVNHHMGQLETSRKSGKNQEKIESLCWENSRTRLKTKNVE